MLALILGPAKPSANSFLKSSSVQIRQNAPIIWNITVPAGVAVAFSLAMSLASCGRSARTPLIFSR